ncbi:hypothetical protein ES703_50464 [subsurface metagenome]
MDLKKSGQKQNFPNNYYTSVPEFLETGGYKTSIPKIVKIPRIFSEDNLHLKYEKFIKECNEKRILVANEDLIQDLKDGKITINNDWDIYIKDFSQFEDGTIRWKSFRFVYSVQDDLNSEVYQRKQEELKNIQVKIQNERNRQDQEEQEIKVLASQLQREDYLDKARKIKEKQKSEFEKLQAEKLEKEKEEKSQSENASLNPPASASPTEASNHENEK